jgi:hypothetical protein
VHLLPWVTCTHAVMRARERVVTRAVAERYWEEICDALAQKGTKSRKADAAAGRSKSLAWKKARGGMVLQNALGKSTPKKELSVRSAAARGDRKAVNRFLREGVNMNVPNALGWTAYHYAMHNGHIDVAKLLVMSGCDETDIPYLSMAEKLTAKQYKVPRHFVSPIFHSKTLRAAGAGEGRIRQVKNV